jgi:hypothetical protein
MILSISRATATCAVFFPCLLVMRAYIRCSLVELISKWCDSSIRIHLSHFDPCLVIAPCHVLPPDECTEETKPASQQIFLAVGNRRTSPISLKMSKAEY